jgi:hypothetical protein
MRKKNNKKIKISKENVTDQIKDSKNFIMKILKGMDGGSGEILKAKFEKVVEAFEFDLSDFEINQFVNNGLV